jgi:hypothetical protein
MGRHGGLPLRVPLSLTSTTPHLDPATLRRVPPPLTRRGGALGGALLRWMMRLVGDFTLTVRFIRRGTPLWVPWLYVAAKPQIEWAGTGASPYGCESSLNPIGQL